jgi:PIN domain nuclease of toxin-antitoxin system
VSGSPRRVALDASALLAWVLRERGYDTVDKILAFAVIPSSAMVETVACQ